MTVPELPSIDAGDFLTDESVRIGRAGGRRTVPGCGWRWILRHLPSQLHMHADGSIVCGGFCGVRSEG